MDTYPETATELGDGFITYLDWQHILYRSEGLETNNWIRFWTNGVRSHTPISWSPSSPPVYSSNPLPKPSRISSVAARRPMQRTSRLRPDTFGSVRLLSAPAARPTSSPAIPAPCRSMTAISGYGLSGLQFRATLVADGDAPQPGPIQFTAAPGIPANTQLPGLAPYDIVCAWNIGAFNHPLEGSNYLGTITFQVPNGAQAGSLTACVSPASAAERT